MVWAPWGETWAKLLGFTVMWRSFPPTKARAFLRQNKVDQKGLAPALIDKSLGPQLGGFESSVLMANLGSIEHWIGMLRSPKWPEKVIGQIDRTKADLGRQIYRGKARKGVKCVGCHRLVKRENQDKPYQSTMIRVSEIGTDPTAANNFILESNPTNGKPWSTGQFQGDQKKRPFR